MHHIDNLKILSGTPKNYAGTHGSNCQARWDGIEGLPTSTGPLPTTRFIQWAWTGGAHHDFVEPWGQQCLSFRLLGQLVQKVHLVPCSIINFLSSVDMIHSWVLIQWLSDCLSVSWASEYGFGLGQASTPKVWERFHLDKGPPFRCLSV
jgi:hypothetical protein